MKRQKLFLSIIASFMAIFVLAQEEPEGYKFEDLTDIKVTSVKSQQKTGTCWSYSTTSFIEAELLRINKQEFDLSEMYFARLAYEEKAQDFVRYHGKLNFGEGGQAHDVMNQVKKYGFTTQEGYQGNEYNPGNYRHSEMSKILKAILEVVITKPNKKLTPVWFDAYKAVLDTYMGKIPEKFNIEGRSITPMEFVKEQNFNVNDYIEITSFTHHPFYEEVILEVPDNWSNDPYYNVPLDDFMEIMNYSLDKGYTFVWDGDVGHDGFEHKKNVAVVPVGEFEFSEPKEEKEVDVAYRQSEFDNLTTTDDHLMHITGLAKDQNGTIYYKTKNSWGDKSNKLGGYLYMSESYMRLNTIAIMVHKDAIPKKIKDKLGL